MNKKFLSRELKFGIIVIAALFIVYFGLNFLKGINIFSSTYSYYAQYDEIGGLVVSTPVYVKGYKVGQVDEITYDFSKQNSFSIKLSVLKEVNLPKGTIIELYEDGIMGGKAIRLLIPTGDAATQGFYKENDLIESRADEGILSALSNNLTPKIELFLQEIDSLIRSIRKIVEDPSIPNMLNSAEKAVADLAVTSGSLKRMMSNEVPNILGKTDTLLSDISAVSGDIKQIDFQSTVANLNDAVSNLNSITDKINKGDGTLGTLLNDRQLYIELLKTTSSADSLLIDLKQNPKRYVHFSLFGGKK